MSLLHVYRTRECGFADFVRAIVPVSTLAKQYGYTYQVVFNHPISAFFEVDTTEVTTTETQFVRLPDLMAQKIPRIVLESNHSQAGIPFRPEDFQQYLRPKASFRAEVDAKRNELHLKPRQYVVFHIRVGDADTEVDVSFMKRITTGLALIRNQHLPILVICSKSFLPKRLASFPGVVVTGCEPCHTTEPIESTDRLKQTLIEFYLMESARRIYGIHGGGFTPPVSGFSYWASRVFGVEYIRL